MSTKPALFFVFITGLAAPSWMAAQTPPPNPPPDSSTPAAPATPPVAAPPDSGQLPTTSAEDGPPAAPERPISLRKFFPNVANDQKQIWLFPVHAVRHKNWIPALAVVGVAAGLVAGADPREAAYFRRSDSFNGFNRVWSGSNTTYGIIGAPAALYIAGLARRDSKMANTALLAVEAFGDAEILTTVFKDIDRRVRPAAIAPNGNFSDTWFESGGSAFRGNGSFPSGHTIAAFSIATVVARRYGNHRWVPFVAYGLATVVGFSRLSLSAHFTSDVFMGAALGYSISRFAVLRQ